MLPVSQLNDFPLAVNRRSDVDLIVVVLIKASIADIGPLLEKTPNFSYNAPVSIRKSKLERKHE
jgi:hypothetical protein